MSAGLGSIAFRFGHMATALSHAASTIPLQSGTDGNFAVTTSQISSTALSSICFCDAYSQMSFSMSAGLGALSCCFGHLATALSHAASTIALQSGTDGNFAVTTSQISSTALSSICFCDAYSQMSFSMSAGLGSITCRFGHLATAMSHAAS